MRTADNGSELQALVVVDRAIRSLAQSLDGKADDARISTDARSLRGLATVMDSLRTDLKRCGGAECFGHRANGFRSWVRHEVLERETARAVMLVDRVARLETALRGIAEITALPPNEVDMFWDWAGAAVRARAIATAALD